MAGVAGQGRRFALHDALEAATMVFWEHGYEGSTLAMLTGAMGVNPPSLYKAFGSKEDLFFAVVRHYNSTHGHFVGQAMDEERSGVRLVPRILHGAADHYARSDRPRGCLVISAAVAVTPQNQKVADRLRKLRNDNIARLALALGNDVADGTLPPETPTADLASYVGATLQGMSQRGRDGADSAHLHTVAQLALAVLPGSAERSGRRGAEN